MVIKITQIITSKEIWSHLVSFFSNYCSFFYFGFFKEYLRCKRRDQNQGQKPKEKVYCLLYYFIKHLRILLMRPEAVRHLIKIMAQSALSHCGRGQFFSLCTRQYHP
jgi:hypothetical protein